MSTIESLQTSEGKTIRTAVRAFILQLINCRGHWEIARFAHINRVAIRRGYDTDTREIEAVAPLSLGIASNLPNLVQIGDIRVQRFGGYIDLRESVRSTSLHLTMPYPGADFSILFGQDLSVIIDQCATALNLYQSQNSHLGPHLHSSAIRNWVTDLSRHSEVVLELYMNEFIGPRFSDSNISVTVSLEIQMKPARTQEQDCSTTS